MNDDTDVSDIKSSIQNAVDQRGKELFSELFSEDEEIGIEDVVRAIKKVHINAQSLGTSMLTLNRNNINTTTQLKDLSTRLQKMIEQLSEVKANTSTMANQRAFSGGGVDKEEILDQIRTEFGEPDETLVRFIRNENKKALRKLIKWGFFYLILVSGVIVVNSVGLDRIATVLKKKDFSSISDGKTETKLNNQSTKSTNTQQNKALAYVIPIKSPFTCVGVNGEYYMPKEKEVKGSVINGYLHYKVVNKGKTYNCKTNSFRGIN